VAFIDGASQTVTSSKAITPNVWTHLSATLNDQAMKLYMNGELCGTHTIQGSITGNTSDVSIARSSQNTGNTFEGYIDDVRIWDHARSLQHITDYVEYNIKGTETGLLANWQFEEGTGTTINDTSANGFHTTIANPIWISSPVTLSDVTYSFVRKTRNATVEQGKTYQYPVILENAGPTIDSYDISIGGGNWAYTLLDALGTSQIDSITLNSGYTSTFIVEVTLPKATVCNGDQDRLTLTIASKNDTDQMKETIITTTATLATPANDSDFAFTITPLTEYDMSHHNN
jgi:hypothetical protein